MTDAPRSDDGELTSSPDIGVVVANSPKRVWWGWWWLVSLALGAWLAVLTVGRFSRTEPASFDDDVALVATVVVAVVPVVVFIAVAMWRRRYLAVLPALAALGGWVVVDRFVDVGAMHWRSSRHAFDQVFAGEPVDCPTEGVCLLGRWRVSGVERWPLLVAVEIDSADGCYAGDFLARAVGADPGIDRFAELVPPEILRRGRLGVTESYDEWYRLCITT